MIEIIFIIILITAAMSVQANYEEPDQKLVEIYDTPPMPFLQFVKYENIALEKTYSRQITLFDMAREEIGLAGEKIHPDINGYYDNYPDVAINRISLTDNSTKSLNLPDGIEIRSTHISWDRKYIAIVSQQDDGIYLGIYNLLKDTYREIEGVRLNDALGINLRWHNDNRHISLLAIDDKRGEKPPKPIVPEKPIIQETNGKTSQTRTYTNLLENSYDEKLFGYYFTSQPVIVDAVKGKFQKLGISGIYNWLELSPDNNYYLVSEILAPFSRELPWYRFPRKYQVWDTEGINIHTLLERPLTDEIPIGGVYNGPRNFEWVPQKSAQILWVEALDNGDPEVIVPHRDRIMLLEDVSNGTPRELLRTEKRYRGIEWSAKENWFIYYDYDRDTFWLRGWLTQIDSSEKSVFENRNIQDRYNNPGNLIYKRNEFNQELFIHQGNKVYFLNNNGATPEGQFPYLKSVDLTDNSHEILFKSREGFMENPICFVNEELTQIAISSQNQDNPRNYYIYNTLTEERNWVTNYQDPYPEWAKLPKEIVKYQRKDGVELSGTLYLPANYNGNERLPLVIDAYPEEYTDSSTAGQNSKSADRFTYFSGASIRYFALSGYAVLAGASIPIIGDPETVNETFIDQTVSSVQAAIDYLDERGIIDPQKVGITGHSYGAFMVTNVLAHSDICAAGIAKSGAYNRTLTPFGFQSERRTLWEAKDFYYKVSPFLHADKINQPLLLIHGEADDNSGTYPIQTKRLYAALKGNGATARMVMLPLEHHGYRARESNLLVIKEMIDWFDKHVKKTD